MRIDDMVKKVLVSEEEIIEINKRLGAEITKEFDGEELTMVGLLKGCNPFFSDLLKEVDLKVVVDYMQTSSYGTDITSSHDVKILKDLDHEVKDKNVLIVDDIIDTGETLQAIMEMLTYKGAKRIEACVLLDKQNGLYKGYRPKFVGTVIPNEFVVGYGLDYNEHYRNLRYVGAFDTSKIKK